MEDSGDDGGGALEEASEIEDREVGIEDEGLGTDDESM